MKLLSKLFNFVIITSKQFAIDESHGLSHSMNVLNYASQLYKSEIILNPHLIDYKKIIYSSAVLHDMCDKKYMCEKEGFNRISNYFANDFTNQEMDDMKKIITSMSYSTVKKNGFPKDLEHLYLPYHIVREADLLSAYDFDRCMIYNLYLTNANIIKNVYMDQYNFINLNFENNLAETFVDATNLFERRVFAHNNDKLFITKKGQELSLQLEDQSRSRINDWVNILSI
jgi:HD superfamily phosphodiesterase